MPRPTPRRARLAGAATTVLLVGAGISAPAAAGQRQDAWGIPSKASITLTGHGYGHGHGMSQYGAEGAAQQGLTAAQIVAFYYPGTTAGSAGGQVSVQISADTTDALEVLAGPGLTVRDLSSGEKAELRRPRAAGGWSPTRAAPRS